jgi:FkbM family methyltransferase
VKKFVHQSLAAFGFSLQRTPRHLRRGKVVNMPVDVGKFKILIPSNSLLPDIFAANPDYSSELGRLVKVALTKYPRLRVIDVGANFGDSVAIVKSQGDVPVLCVEGDEDCHALLKENTRQFKDVSIHQVFLGERTQAIDAVLEKKGWNTTIVPSGNGSSLPLQLQSLDDMISGIQQQSSEYKLLKIDTEGFDCCILRGGLNYLKDVRPILVFEYNRDNMRRIGETGIETLETLKAAGYDIILFYDGQGRLVLSSTLESPVVRDLHFYANGTNGFFYYYDLVVFHRDDQDIAQEFVSSERARRDEQS